jgi:hypothetical protein
MNGGWQERSNGGSGGNGQRGMYALGIMLVALGAFFLITEQTNFDWNRYGWPMFVIVPGVILLAIGLVIPHDGGLGAAIPGAILTTVGLILAWQDASGAYASWAYAWALVAPGSVGFALAAWGLLHRRWDQFDAGLRTMATGLGLFIGFGLFFENVLDIDNGQSSTALRDAFPLLAVGLGVLIVLANLMPKRNSSRPAESDWMPPTPPAS